MGDAEVDGDSERLDGGDDDGSIPPECPDDECDGQCVNTDNDPRYCGSCERACARTELCEAGECVEAPDCREVPCTGFTYCDLATGDCLPGCGSSDQCLDNAHCDAMSHECLCDNDFHRCSGLCVANDDTSHCGERCTPCPTDPNGRDSCNGVECELVCNSGFLMCGDACRACPEDAAELGCDGDRCVASSCGDGLRLCEGACAPCETEGVAATTCDGDACVVSSCDDGYRRCEGACAPCPTDGVVEHACSGGLCVAAACAAEYYPCESGCCAWTLETVATSDSETIGRAPEIALDGDDEPHIVAFGDDVRHFFKMRGSWTLTTPDFAVDPSHGWRGDIAVSGTLVWLCFREGEGLTCTNHDQSDGSWGSAERIIDNPFGSAHGFDVALDIASTGEPHACYDARVGSDKDIRCALRSGGIWEATTIRRDSSPSRIHMELGADDVPRILYDSGGSGGYLLTSAVDEWEGSGVADGYYDHMDMALDSSDQPHVCADRRSTGLAHGYYDGEEWIADVIDPDSTGVLCAIDIDTEDNAHIVYADDANNLRYAVQGSTGWTFTTIHLDEGVLFVQAPDLVLDGSGRPHIVVHDEGEGFTIYYITGDARAL